MAKPQFHKKLTRGDVQDLGRVLIDVSNLYPTKFLTERDFFPLVVTYLTGRIPSVDTEVAASEGKIDFQLRGNNPTWLEIAVQPRILIDKNCPNVKFPGHASRTALYATQNRRELYKLRYTPNGLTRFLLLVDLTGTYDVESLKRGYKDEEGGDRRRNGKPIRVVFASQDKSKDTHFVVKA